MSRVKADLLLLLAAMIWGFAFIAQKTAMESVGPYTFVGSRFLISAAFVLPFAFREMKRAQAVSFSAHKWLLLGLCAAFSVGAVLQQFGVHGTSVTNAGFLTSLYVLFVPIASLLVFRKKPNAIVWLAAPLCVFGVFLLGDASLTGMKAGDLLVIGCAIIFSFHIILTGIAVKLIPNPLTLATLQYSVCGIGCMALALMFEDVSAAALMEILPALLYAGILSGSIAFTLQIIAQQHTPPSDAAIICGSESLFAAIGGVLLMQDHLSPIAWAGCGVIFIAILLVELYPLLRKGSDLDGNAGIVLGSADRER